MAALRSSWPKWELTRREKQLVGGRAAGFVQETPFHPPEKIVECLSEVEGRRFVGCDTSLNVFAR